MTWTTISTFAAGTLAGTILKEGWSFFREWWLQRHKTRIQALTDNAVYVTKAYFDTEFMAMRDVFKYLSDTKLALNGVRPEMDFAAGEEKTVRLKWLGERLQELRDSHNRLLPTLDSFSAFYPAELYDVAKKCQVAAWTEISQVEHPAFPPFTREWQLEGERNHRKYQENYEEARKIIQARLSRLAVLP
jgi:hypothetical protein